MLITEPVYIFALTLLIILLAPILFERLRVQGIVGLIIAGILIGPHAFGVLDRRGVFEVLGAVGLHMVMFIAGMEINPNEFRRYRQNSLVFGAFTFLIPQLLGTFAARMVLGFSWPSSILLASMFASHTLVTYPILSRMGLAKNRSVTTAVGGTILTDTLAMLVLAVIAESAQSALGISFWIMEAFNIGLLLFIGFRLLPMVGYWFFKNVATDGITEFLFILAAAFGTASVSKALGIEPILGSFFAGLALSQLVPEQSILMNRIQFTANAIFIPFFLISTGMLVNLSILWTSSEMWTVAVFMVCMVLFTKWLAAVVSGWLLGFSHSERALMFGLSVNQAAATLAAVMVGYRIGLFDDAVLNGTILMILVSCTAGSWLTDRFGRRVALESAVSHPDIPQKDRIMVTLANPETADSLIDLALLLRNKKSPEPIYPLYVVQEGENVDDCLAKGEQILARAATQIIASETPAHPVARIDLNITEGILHSMTEMRISRIILGWSGRNAAKNIIFHTILDQIIARGKQSIIVSKFTQPLNTTRRILVIIPPLFERQAGFEAVIRMLKTMAVQVGGDMEIIADTETIARSRSLVETIQPSCPLSFHSLDTWRNLLPTLRQKVVSTDMLAFLSIRRTQFAWQPSLEKIPGQIAKAFSGVNFLTVYPSAEEYMENEPETNETPDWEIPGVVLRRVVLPNACESLEASLNFILSTEFGEHPSLLGRLTRKLLETAPIELAHDIVLIHAHVSQITETTVFIGSAQSEECTSQTGGRTLLLLLSPESNNPEKHLQTLARLARLAKSMES